MKKVYIAIVIFFCIVSEIDALQSDTTRMSLKEAISLAQLQSVDAAVALNELKTAYWQYRTI